MRVGPTKEAALIAPASAFAMACSAGPSALPWQCSTGTPKGLPPAPSRQGTLTQAPTKRPAGQAGGSKAAVTPAGAAAATASCAAKNGAPAPAADDDDGLAPEELEVFEKVAAMMERSDTATKQQLPRVDPGGQQVVVPARAFSPTASTFTCFNAAAGANTNSSPVSAGRQPSPAVAAAPAGMLAPPPPLPPPFALPWPCMQPFHPGMMLLPPFHPAAAFQQAAWMHQQQQLVHAQQAQQQQQWQQASTAAAAAAAAAATAEDPEGAPVPWTSFAADDKSDDLDLDLCRFFLPGADSLAARRRSASRAGTAAAAAPQHRSAAPPAPDAAAAAASAGSSRAKRILRIASVQSNSGAANDGSSKKKSSSSKKHSSGSLGVDKQQGGSGGVKKPGSRIVLKGSSKPVRAASAASLAGVLTPQQQEQPQLGRAHSTPNLDLGVLHSLDNSCLSSGADAAGDQLMMGVWGTDAVPTPQEPLSDDDLDSLLPCASTHPGLDLGSSML